MPKENKISGAVVVDDYHVHFQGISKVARISCKPECGIGASQIARTLAELLSPSVQLIVSAHLLSQSCTVQEDCCFETVLEMSSPIVVPRPRHLRIKRQHAGFWLADIDFQH